MFYCRWSGIVNLKMETLSNIHVNSGPNLLEKYDVIMENGTQQLLDVYEVYTVFRSKKDGKLSLW